MWPISLSLSLTATTTTPPAQSTDASDWAGRPKLAHPFLGQHAPCWRTRRNTCPDLVRLPPISPALEDFCSAGFRLGFGSCGQMRVRLQCTRRLMRTHRRALPELTCPAPESARAVANKGCRPARQHRFRSARCLLCAWPHNCSGRVATWNWRARGLQKRLGAARALTFSRQSSCNVTGLARR